MNGYFEDINKGKYLTLVPTNESKEKNKKHEKLWSKIRNLIKSITKNLDDYDEKYIKFKFKSDDKLPLNKVIEIHSMISFRAVLVINQLFGCCSFPYRWRSYMFIWKTRREVEKMRSLYGKLKDSYQYLHSSSCHPYHCAKEIRYSQALGLNRICSDPNSFDRWRNDLEKWLI